MKFESFPKGKESKEESSPLYVENSNDKYEKIVEKYEKITENNNSIHKAESKLLKFKKRLDSIVLYLALSVSQVGNAQELKAEDIETMDWSNTTSLVESEERKQLAVEMLGEDFHNPEKLIEKCNIAEAQVYNPENKKTIVHLAQVHSDKVGYYEQDGLVSQNIIYECIKSAIDNHKGDYQLPIAIELIQNEENLDSAVMNLLKKDLVNYIVDFSLFKDTKPEEFTENFEYLKNGRGNSFLTKILLHYKEDEVKNLLQDLVSRDYIKEIESAPLEKSKEVKNFFYKFYDLLKDIEKEKNIDFFIADRISLTLADFLVMELEGDSRSFQQLFFDLFYYREDLSIKKTLERVSSDGIGFIVFGAAHDFRDDAIKNGSNLIRLETNNDDDFIAQTPLDVLKMESISHFNSSKFIKILIDFFQLPENSSKRKVLKTTIDYYEKLNDYEMLFNIYDILHKFYNKDLVAKDKEQFEMEQKIRHILKDAVEKGLVSSNDFWKITDGGKTGFPNYVIQSYSND